MLTQEHPGRTLVYQVVYQIVYQVEYQVEYQVKYQVEYQVAYQVVSEYEPECRDSGTRVFQVYRGSIPYRLSPSIAIKFTHFTHFTYFTILFTLSSSNLRLPKLTLFYISFSQIFISKRRITFLGFSTSKSLIISPFLKIVFSTSTKRRK